MATGKTCFRRAKKAGLLRSYRKDRVLGKGANTLKPWRGITQVVERRETRCSRRPGCLSVLVQPWAYKLINALVDSGKVDVRAFYKEMLRPATWKVENGKVVEDYIPWELADKELWVDLVRLVLSPDSFPFRRCALCRTIFAPASKKQKKYCSKECANKAVSLTPERRKYMKDYMADKRQAERKS